MTVVETNHAIDKDAIRAKYAQEREKRLRVNGDEQYQQLESRFAHMSADPYLPVKERAPKTDHVTFAFIGGGFAGLTAGARLVEAGITDVRIIEKAGDFGGTWYWNRYPGAQCDTASMIYLPMLEETGHMPSEKYVHAPEILEHCKRIANQYNLYKDVLFHTEVEEVSWQEDSSRWLIKTNRGDAFTAQFVGMGTGPMHVAKLPGFEGIESFKGHSFHTTRWDYEYTGGDPEGGLMEKLADKRVAVIGTGATAVQCVPHLARAAKEVLVCQRTPSSVDVRANRPIERDWFKGISGPGWQKRWMENFTVNQTGGHASEDLVQDGWTDLANRIRTKMESLPEGKQTAEDMLAAYEESDMEKMEEIRSRVDAIVEDKETAQELKAWYAQLCKRPCFHDEYLQSFNTPGTKLVDTDGQGVERITEKGVVVAGVEYEVDCIIYASGFEVGNNYGKSSCYNTIGRDGLTLGDYWEDGMRSKHGMHVHGFPNAFLVTPTQGANLISNITHNIVDSAVTIAKVVAHAVKQGSAEVEVTKKAEDDWLELLSTSVRPGIGGPDCTPGYYNNEGQPLTAASKRMVGYPAGAVAYFNYIEDWRNSGEFEGLAFS